MGKGVGHLAHVWSYGVRKVVSSIPDRGNIVRWVFHPTRWLVRFSLIWTCLSLQILNLFRTSSSWGSVNYRPSAPLLYEVASHVKQLPFRPLLLLYLAETSIFLGRNVNLSWPNRPSFWPKRPCFFWRKRIQNETTWLLTFCRPMILIGCNEMTRTNYIPGNYFCFIKLQLHYRKCSSTETKLQEIWFFFIKKWICFPYNELQISPNQFSE